MKLKQILLMSLTALSLLALNSCTSGDVSNPGGGGVIINPINYAWFDMYGSGCATSSAGPRPGCNFFWYDNQLVKIMDFEDPYFQNGYNLIYGYYTFYLNGILYDFTGYAWISPTGIIYDQYGNALNNKKKKSRDVIQQMAKAETAIVEKAGRDFAAKFSLDASKGIQIARSLNQWAKIGKSRVRTEADIAEFTTKLYGVDYNKVKKALLEAQKGDTQAMRATIGEAAKNWGTSEENMKDILNQWYKGVVKF